MDERLLRDARENLDGANAIIAGIRAEGGYRFYEEVTARTGMVGQELEDYVKGAAATFRRVAIESSVAVFLFKECALRDRTIETFRDLVNETIECLKATRIPELKPKVNPELEKNVEKALFGLQRERVEKLTTEPTKVNPTLIYQAPKREEASK
jgi:hypothetical protein